MDSNPRTYYLSCVIVKSVNGFKGSTKKNNGKSIRTLAREAIRWAQDSLQINDGSVFGQAKHETFDSEVIGDDSILACCLYIRFRKINEGT